MHDRSMRSALLFLLLLFGTFTNSSLADTARLRERHGLGLEGLGRTALYGVFYDYCITPKFALGATYGAGAQISGSQQLLLPVHATYYYWGEYLSAYATMGVLYLPGQSLVFIPGLGLEYRRHGGLLVRAGGYYFINTFPLLSGALWPGVSLGFAF